MPQLTCLGICPPHHVARDALHLDSVLGLRPDPTSVGMDNGRQLALLHFLLKPMHKALLAASRTIPVIRKPRKLGMN